MRVLAVTPNYPPGSLVGAWLATHRFLTHLVARGHEVTVFAARCRDKAYTLDGVTVETGLRGRSHGDRLAQSADVVVSHAGDGGIGLEIADQLPAVRMVHGHGYAQIGDARLAVFNSHSLARSSKWDGEAIVCHPPVLPDRVRVTPGEAVTIINCSTDKGIKTAWRAAERLPGHRFLGVKGGYGRQLEPRAKNFQTIPTQADVRDVYRRTRVLLMPSVFETWGMVGVEAMCSGIPVIAHPTPGLQESLGSAGIFVDRSDTAGWVEAIRSLDDPDIYAEASARALARAAELDPQPDLDRFAEAIEAL